MLDIQSGTSWGAQVCHCSQFRQWWACCPCSRLASGGRCSCTSPGRCGPSGLKQDYQASPGLCCCCRTGNAACSLRPAGAGSLPQWSAMGRQKDVVFHDESVWFGGVNTAICRVDLIGLTCTMISLLLALLRSWSSSPKHRVTVGSGAGNWPSWYSCRAGTYNVKKQTNSCLDELCWISILL